MRTLLPIILPTAVLAQSYPVGNQAGAILGIFAMCGSAPVDCGNGWCCLSGQTCTTGPKGANTMCNDPLLLDNSSGKGGVVVNAAYFGKLQDHQVSPPGNGSSSTSSSIQHQTTSSSIESAKPVLPMLLTAVAGTALVLLSSL